MNSRFLQFLQSFAAVAYPILLAIMIALIAFTSGVVCESTRHTPPLIQVPADQFMEMVELAK